LDAGAKNIHFTFTKEGFSCADDGCGMSEETLVSAMLTLGGSQKEQNATGGFGAAKKIILFAHESYSIQTNDIKVEGKVLQYTLTKGSPIKGTIISGVYSNSEEFKSIEGRAKNILSDSNLTGRCRVFINDNEFTEWATFEPFKTSEYGDICLNKSDSSGYVKVLHNGLYMFSSYLGSMAEQIGLLYFNVLVPSKEAFSQNREMLRGKASEYFASFKAEVAINPKSVTRPKHKSLVWRGRNRLRSMLKRLAPSLSSEQLNYLKNVVENAGSTETAQDIVASFVRRNCPTAVSKIIENKSLFSDFYLDGSVDDATVKKLDPVNGKKTYKLLASLYRILIEEIGKILEFPCEFCIGFVAEDGVEGRYARRDGINLFFINPKLAKITDRNERFYKVFSVALHEYVHYMLEDGSHNETYAGELTDAIAKVLPKMRGVVAMMKQASDEVDCL